jgi:hypothetical protein
MADGVLRKKVETMELLIWELANTDRTDCKVRVL